MQEEVKIVECVWCIVWSICVDPLLPATRGLFSRGQPRCSLPSKSTIASFKHFLMLFPLHLLRSGMKCAMGNRFGHVESHGSHMKCRFVPQINYFQSWWSEVLAALNERGMKSTEPFFLLWSSKRKIRVSGYFAEYLKKSWAFYWTFWLVWVSKQGDVLLLLINIF